MNRKLKIILCLAGIFAAGAAAGAFVALRVVRTMGNEKTMMANFVPRQMARLSEELELNPEQAEEVNKILQQGAVEIGALRRESLTATSGKVREMNAKIAALLTPGQTVKFEEFMNRQRERMRRFQMDRPDGRRGSGDGPRGGSRREPPPESPPVEPPPPGP